MTIQEILFIKSNRTAVSQFFYTHHTCPRWENLELKNSACIQCIDANALWVFGHTQKLTQINNNCTQYTLYGCYGIILKWNWKPHYLCFYLCFDILTIGHEMLLISVTLVCWEISEISFASHCYIPYFEGLPSKENLGNYT